MAGSSFSGSSGRGPHVLSQGSVGGGSLLYLQRHRAHAVFSGATDLLVDVRVGSEGIWKCLKDEPERTRLYLDVMGFGTICRLGGIRIDHALITALLERWRPETHTFHLPVGEVLITLQDVEDLLGLRVDG